MKKNLLLYQGKAATSRGGGRYAKDVLRTGRWTHPVTGQEVVVDGARLEKLARNTNKYLQHVDRERIPFPDGHSFAADKNLGWWPGPFFVMDEKLFSVVEPTNPATAKLMDDGSLAAVSAMIEFGRGDAHGNTYDEVITHICATPYPVIDGQKDFVKLSAETTEGELYIPQELAGMSPEGHSNRTEGRMDWKKLAKALGLPEDTPEAEIQKKLDATNAAASKLSAVEGQQTALSTALKAQGLEFKDGKLVKLSSSEQLDTTIKPGDSDEVKRLKAQLADTNSKLDSQGQRLDTLDEQGRKTFAENAKKMALEHVKEGRIPPSLAAAVTEVLSIQGEVNALTLSSDGKVTDKALNLVDRIQGVLSKLPSIKGTALAQLGAEGEGKESDGRRARAREIAASVGGKKVEKEPAGSR